MPSPPVQNHAIPQPRIDAEIDTVPNLGLFAESGDRGEVVVDQAGFVGIQIVQTADQVHPHRPAGVDRMGAVKLYWL